MTTLWAICKDPGGTGNLLPILPILRERGLEVKLFFQEGTRGKSVIENSGEKYQVLATPFSGTCYTIQSEVPDVFVTSMCSGESVGRDLVSFFRKEKVPTAALQDSWGARLKTDWADPEYRPDLILVNDRVAKEIVLRCWGGGIRVAVTGYPSFDALAKINRVEAGLSGRTRLGVEDGLPIVFYPGQIWHSGRTLSEVVGALNAVGEPCHLVASRHGGMNEAPEEAPLWELAEAMFRWKFHRFTDFRHVREVILASKVVVGMYSSLQTEAAALGVPVISVLYPEYGAALYRKETEGAMEQFPLVELGCSAIATDRRSLVEILSQALLGDLGLRTSQEITFPLDGNNARRTVNAILSLL